MARVRDEYGNWTIEADEFTRSIKGLVNQMLDQAERRGFNNEDAFYLIFTEVNEQQLLRLLEHRQDMPFADN